jgi:hypothetical protein
MSQNVDFDMQAAWLRRFKSDAESSLKAFALRLKEAMPELVTIRESKSFFAHAAKTTGVSVDLGDSRYVLEILGGQLKASIALVVRGIALNTRSVEPADWFARLAEETRKASDHAKTLSQSLADFMAD